jgi:Holliday junction resolvasome RuvABC endonuclease subunit
VRNRRSVLGLDLSLTRPAGVAIPAGWVLGDWGSLAVTSLETAPCETDEDRIKRIILIVGHMRDFALRHRVSDCFVENYAFNAHSSSVTKLAELGGAARVEFFLGGWFLHSVPASSARKLLLGKLPRKGAKVAVQQALYRHGATFRNDDECDAFCVASFGLSEIGLPFLSLA